MRVLIVDDSEIMRNKLSFIFKNLGMEVIGVAKNGIEAICLYKIHKPDLVTLDINMPFDGINTLKVIKTIDCRARVIMVSENPTKDFVIDSLRLGAEYFLVKPLHMVKLQNAINNFKGKKYNKLLVG